ncbi:MAG: glycosyltransferase [Candidatus Sumerlaeia bacterium]
MPDNLISVVIVTWNCWNEVRDCLLTLEAARAQVELEIIVVDNGSVDFTPENIAECFPNVILIRNADNAGFARGCNQGLARATGRFLLLLNPDAEIEGEALRALQRCLAQNQRIGMVGPALRFPDGTFQKSTFTFLSPWSYIKDQSSLSVLWVGVLRRVKGRRPLRRRRVHHVDWLMGACLMTRRDVYERIGGLDEEYYMYCEDADWCWRARQAGYLVAYVPFVSARHHYKGTSRRRKYFTYVRNYESQLLFYRKHRGRWAQSAFRALVVADLLVRWPLTAAAWLAGAGDRRLNAERLRAIGAVLRLYLGQNKR